MPWREFWRRRVIGIRFGKTHKESGKKRKEKKREFPGEESVGRVRQGSPQDGEIVGSEGGGQREQGLGSRCIPQ